MFGAPQAQGEAGASIVSQESNIEPDGSYNYKWVEKRQKSCILCGASIILLTSPNKRLKTRTCANKQNFDALNWQYWHYLTAGIYGGDFINSTLPDMQSAYKKLIFSIIKEINQKMFSDCVRL